MEKSTLYFPLTIITRTNKFENYKNLQNPKDCFIQLKMHKLILILALTVTLAVSMKLKIELKGL